MQFVSCTYHAHGQAVLDILNEVIVNSTALYDYHPRSLNNIVDWFEAKESLSYPVIGAVSSSGDLLGFATYGTFRSWPAYKYSIEHSVYIHKDRRGEGVGEALMKRLIIKAEDQGYHLMVGGIDEANAASVALHVKLGFAHSGTVREAGFKFGRWLDLALYQLILKTPSGPADG